MRLLARFARLDDSVDEAAVKAMPGVVAVVRDGSHVTLEVTQELAEAVATVL